MVTAQAHLGVRLKKDGYTVIGADWKRQEYFEEKEFCDEFHEVRPTVWCLDTQNASSVYSCCFVANTAPLALAL
jgi:hypothetical protein